MQFFYILSLLQKWNFNLDFITPAKMVQEAEKTASKLKYPSWIFLRVRWAQSMRFPFWDVPIFSD